MDIDRSANEGPGSRRSGYSDRRCAGQKNGWRHRPQRVRRRSVGRMLVLAGEASSRYRCRNRFGRLLSRTQQPAGSSTGARSWPWSGQEIRWRRCRGCACYTYHSDPRSNLLKLSESLVGTTRLFLCLKPAVPRTAKRSNLKLWNDSLQMHGQEKCLRSPGPLPL